MSRDETAPSAPADHLVIAAALGETALEPLTTLERLAAAQGMEFMQALLVRAQQVHAGKGMRRPGGRKRRTLGGVFFALAKDALGHTAFAKTVYTDDERVKHRALAKQARSTLIAAARKRAQARAARAAATATPADSLAGKAAPHA
jgi:hypothetical protein